MVEGDIKYNPNDNTLQVDTGGSAPVELTDANGTAYTVGIDNSNSIPVTIDSYQNQLNVNVQSWAPAYTFSNNSDTGFYMSNSGTISINATIGGIPFTRETMREHIENAYIVGKMTKEQLIDHLKAFHDNNGLDMAETMEEIELAKEKFFKDILEKK